MEGGPGSSLHTNSEIKNPISKAYLKNAGLRVRRIFIKAEPPFCTFWLCMDFYNRLINIFLLRTHVRNQPV
jgi:hypothetical protein